MKTKRIYLIFAIVFQVIAMVSCTSCDEENDPSPALKVMSITPANNSTNVDINTVITAVFDRDVDPTTLNGIKMFDKNNNLISLNVNCDRKTVTISKSTPFEFDMMYTITITSILKAEDGGEANDYTYSFTTKKAPFNVLTINIANNATNVELDADIVITLNKDMDHATVNNTNVKVADKNNVNVAVSFTVSGKIITIHPTANYAEDMKYTVSVSGVIAKDGVVVNSFTSTFTTKKIPFAVVSSIPANNAIVTDVWSYIKIVFNKDVDKQTLNTSVKLFEVGGYQKAIEFMSSSEKEIILRRQDGSPFYTAKFEVRISGLKSTDGSTIESTVIPFEVNQPPLYVRSVVPVSGAVNVPHNSSVVVEFSELIDNTNNYLLGGISFSGGNCKYEMIFDEIRTVTLRIISIDPNTTYTVETFTDIKSLDGDIIPAGTVITTFTTAASK